MRLVCPNCDAQYEVDDAAIPEAGRDVQCSNCGHAWFQRPPEIDAEEEFEDEIFLSDDDAVAPPSPPQPEPAPVAPVPSRAIAEEDDEDADEAPPAAVEEPPVRKPALDEALMSVLREEAEREAAVRQAEVPRIETVVAPPAMPTAAPPPVPPSVLAARERFAALSVDHEDVAEEEEVVVRPSRRELLPDIEEINSTLRASSEPRGVDEDLPLPPVVVVVGERRGFRSGFMLMVLIAAGLWLAYVMAPRISTQIPASASMLDAYVATVDKTRVSVDSALKSASKSIRSLSGQDG